MQGSRQVGFNQTTHNLPLSKDHYQARLASIDAEANQLESQSQRLTWARPALFLPAVGLLLAGYTQSHAPTGTTIAGWLTLLAFLAALVWHEAIQNRIHRLQNEQSLFRRLLARLDRRWNDLPTIPLPTGQGSPQSAPHQLPFQWAAEDLDVFGERSLFQWFCLAGTSIGKARVVEWFSTWIDPQTIEDRQLAVRELAPQRASRETILIQSAILSQSHASPEHFTEWAAGPSWLQKNPISHRLSWLGPTLIIAGLSTLAFSKFNQFSTGQWTGLWIAVSGLILNILVMLGRVGAIHDIFQRINTGHEEVHAYQNLYQAIAQIQGTCPWIEKRRRICCDGPHSAIQGFQHLERLIRLANLQRNQLFYLPYIILQFFFMLDFRVLALLEGWQRQYGSASLQWLHALADWEAIVSAATIADENPDWAFPIWNTPNTLLEAKQIGHPLLADHQRVPNDLSITNQRRLLLITGSNMAGKSTFLRSLGLNCILARTGAPMCCQEFHGQVFDLATSIRITDSLQDGVSFFMAELHRLRDVVHAVQWHRSHQRPMLVLLDEILQGTNSRERQIAVMEVVQRLIGDGAVTCISTHDLELADQSFLQDLGQIVHFREYFELQHGQEQMRFDYRMRPGPTPTTNALKLLELVGLRPNHPAPSPIKPT